MDRNKLDAIFWDFDGVILDSNAIRDIGFELVLKQYPKNDVEKLLKFHKQNGGLSRYVKFRYFFEEIRNESISDKQINIWAERFSIIMKDKLLSSNLLISETIQFIKHFYVKIPMFIVSGSSQKELRYLCEMHGISKYFVAIHGSPTPKKKWVEILLKNYELKRNNCLLIGDSINDYEAAETNGIKFMAYNSTKELESKTSLKIILKNL